MRTLVLTLILAGCGFDTTGHGIATHDPQDGIGQVLGGRRGGSAALADGSMAEPDGSQEPLEDGATPELDGGEPPEPPEDSGPQAGAGGAAADAGVAGEPDASAMPPDAGVDAGEPPAELPSVCDECMGAPCADGLVCTYATGRVFFGWVCLPSNPDALSCEDNCPALPINNGDSCGGCPQYKPELGCPLLE